LAEYVLEWIRTYLRHSEGADWAGKPFEPMDWQRDDLFLPLFGWVRAHEERGGFVRRYNRVYCEVPKKSGKSPTGSVIGTYTWAGDGEPGAKVFSAATDKDQASIVHIHAMNMVQDAPELSRRTKINATTRRMVFLPTRSVYSVVSGRSSEHRGREGLNAHCTISDELHAWKGDQLYNAMRYMYASRREPINFQITTAGEDMQSVCRQQHDYARAILKGEFVDDGFLPIIYAADRDDDWTDEEVWEKANPSLGTTVFLTEMRQSCNEAKQSPRAVSAFKRYRLNIWATAEEAWLDQDKWAACEASYTEKDLAGQTCWAALDLAKTLDMTALALIFPPNEDGMWHQLVYFWMPEETVAKRQHLADYRGWQQAGWLEVTPGGECDYEFVRKRLLELREVFDIKGVVYDPKFADYFMQRLEEEDGIERVKFDQTVKNYSDPASEYERLISTGQMLHNGNPILTWQAGHIVVQCKANGALMPTKAKKGDYRTIDGIVASIMALAEAMLVTETASVYETGDLFVIE
jgi:phage terminase large subunit-like protein